VRAGEGTRLFRGTFPRLLRFVVVEVSSDEEEQGTCDGQKHDSRYSADDVFDEFFVRLPAQAGSKRAEREQRETNSPDNKFPFECGIGFAASGVPRHFPKHGSGDCADNEGNRAADGGRETKIRRDFLN
jgi:hypothetical protein